MVEVEAFYTVFAGNVYFLGEIVRRSAVGGHGAKQQAWPGRVREQGTISVEIEA